MSKQGEPEARVLHGCLKYLRARNIYHWRNNTGSVEIRPGPVAPFWEEGKRRYSGLPAGRAAPGR